MKLVFFDDFRLGVVKDALMIDVSHVVRDIPHVGPHDLINGLIAHFEDYRPHLEEAANTGTAMPAGRMRLRSPLPKPFNIDCMAVNYMEDGTRSEPAPINAFFKSPNSVIGD